MNDPTQGEIDLLAHIDSCPTCAATGECADAYAMASQLGQELLNRGDRAAFISNGSGEYDSDLGMWHTETGCQCYGCVTMRHSCEKEKP